MKPVGYAPYLALSLLVIAWCILHSAMIAVSVTDYLEEHLGKLFRFYRLFYNLIAILTLIPIALFAYSLHTPPLFNWSGFLRIGQIILSGGAFLLFIFGARHYDARQFLGLSQMHGENVNRAITDTGALDTSGVLNFVRHPWYLAGLLLIWARELDASAILINGILSGYLLVGAQLEEKKLIREFGEQYLAYQKRVSMLIPCKWLKAKIRK